jgi:hypothetical protein
MSPKKFVALIFYFFDGIQPLLGLTVGFGVRSALDLAAESGVFQGLFHRVLSDFESKHSMRKIFVSGFFMDRLQLFLQSLEFLLQSLQLIFLSWF